MQNHSPQSSVQNRLFIHFGLQENPFGGTPDPRFLFHSETHREALASLINGIDCEFGFQVLVAQPGMGKTTLLFNFLEGFRATAYTAFVFQPQLAPHELLQSLLAELGAGTEDTSVRKLSEQINQLLGRAAQERKRVIVVVDEAQNLDFAVLETLRQLSNFETAHSKLMQIVLAGQPQLVKKLAAPEQEQLRQRISSIGRLSPLNVNETRAYISHRLRTAGYRGNELFTLGAQRKIWETSKGVPRNINTLCFNAMLLGFAGNTRSIDETILAEATRDLDMPSVFEDMYRLEATPAVPSRNGNGNGNGNGNRNGNGNGHSYQPPTRETRPVETESLKLVSLPGSQRSGWQKPENDPEPAVHGNGNTRESSENIPLALVEAIVRISQTLEEQRILLTKKTVSIPEPLPAPVPVPAVAVTVPAPAGALNTIPAPVSKVTTTPVTATKPATTTPATKATSAPNPSSIEKANAEKKTTFASGPTTSNPASSEKKESLRKPEKITSPPAKQDKSGPRAQPEKVDAVPAVLAKPPMADIHPAVMTKHAEGGFWSKALALVTITGVLTFVVVEKSPWQNQARASGIEASQTTVEQTDPASVSPVPKNSPESPMEAPVRSSKSTTSGADASRTSSDDFDDVTVRKFPDTPVAKPRSSTSADLNTIFFEQNSAAIAEQYRAAMQQIADALARDPQSSAILEGHTDDTGEEVYNLDLSSRRAIAVRQALINEFNVPSTQVTAIGSGSAAPVQPNTSPTGRAYNRRVTVRYVHLSE